MKRIALAALTASIAMQAAAQNQQPGPSPPQPPQPTVLWDRIEIKTIDLGNRTCMLIGHLRNVYHSFGRL